MTETYFLQVENNVPYVTSAVPLHVALYYALKNWIVSRPWCGANYHSFWLRMNYKSLNTNKSD